MDTTVAGVVVAQETGEPVAEARLYLRGLDPSVRRGAWGSSGPDGRFTILMPHPERVFRTVQHSWHPETWGEDGPWMRMFRNARKWVG